MPSGRPAKPPRLVLRAERSGRKFWAIRDGGREIRTGCGEADRGRAAAGLAAYIAGKHESTLGAHHLDRVAIADVLTFYGDLKAPGSADPDINRRHDELWARIGRLVDYWGDKPLAAVKGATSRAYVAWRTRQPRRNGTGTVSTATARRELEDLRAAINAYHAEYTLAVVPKVLLPPPALARERFLTRHEAARLLGAALGFVWSVEEGRFTGRRDRVTRTRRRHAARFILIGLYSARREATIRRTQWRANTTGPWFDLEAGVYQGRGALERPTKKRRPPARIAWRLMPHLTRWRRMDEALGAELGREVAHVVHRPNGEPLAGKIKTGWAGILADAGLGPDVVRHSLRHTAATWTMQAGTDLWKAAGWLGMTVEMLEENYGHHHPDFQDEAAGAFGGARPDRNK